MAAGQGQQQQPLVYPDTAPHRLTGYDAIMVPGGGLDEEGRPLPCVLSRLDAALAHANTSDYFLMLGRYSAHVPPVVDNASFPIDEATAAGSYLIDHGIEGSRIYLDRWSMDTIGNAVFARLMHSDPRAWRKLLVITSEFHMPRVRAIFDWIFTLPPAGAGGPVDLSYEATPNTGMSDSIVQARMLKEAESLKSLNDTKQNVTDLAELHQFIFGEHDAYMAGTRESELNHTDTELKGKLGASYGPQSSLNQVNDTAHASPPSH